MVFSTVPEVKRSSLGNKGNALPNTTSKDYNEEYLEYLGNSPKGV